MGTVQIDPLGVVDDRRLMLVDDKGLFLSQRVDPVLATITPTLIGRSMIVSTPSQQPISLELSPGGTTVAVSIWRDTVSAVDQGDEIASWFSAVVGRAVRLVWFTGSSAERFVWSKNSALFHDPDCFVVKRIGAANRREGPAPDGKEKHSCRR